MTRQISASFMLAVLFTATSATAATSVTNVVFDASLTPITFYNDVQSHLVEAESTARQANPTQSYATLVENLLQDDDYVRELARAKSLSVMGPTNLVTTMPQTTYGTNVLQTLLSSPEWMIDTWTAGDVKNPANYLNALSVLWKYDKRYVEEHPNTRLPSAESGSLLARKCITAMALNNVGSDVNRVDSWEAYREFFDRGRMHCDVYNYDIWELRFGLNSQNFSHHDLRRGAQLTGGKINTRGWASWQVRYRRYNLFDDIIHGANYNRPWQHLITGSSISREIGGVCGAISTYGALSCQAHGTVGITGGQPGHCATPNRNRDEATWNIGSNIGGPTGAHFSFWNMTYFKALEYFDNLFRDMNAYRAAHLRMWAAEMAILRERDANGSIVYSDGLNGLFRAAAAKAPNNYLVWKTYAAWLNEVAPNEMPLWIAWAEGVANGMKLDEEPAWKMIADNFAARAKRNLGKEGVALIYKRLYRIITQTTRSTTENFFLGTIALNTHRTLLDGHLPSMLTLVETALDANFGKSWYPAAIISWGNGAFTSAADKNAFLGTVSQVYAAHGDASGLLKFVVNSIQSASATGNVELFNQMADVYDEQTGDRVGGYVDDTFGGQLLSAKGCLTLSSYSTTGSGNNISYVQNDIKNARRVIDDSTIGLYSFKTAAEQAPWVKVTLPGNAALTGILIQNPTGEPALQSVPFRVSISEDGELWTTVLETSGRSVTTLKIPLDLPRARYVKIERIDSTVNVQMQLQKIQVYGNPLY